MTKTSDFITSNIVFVEANQLISDVVKIMTEKNISSVLVANEHDEVVGILTERDIVQKFTLLDVNDKLTRTVNTIMSPGILYVKLDRLMEDAAKLYFEKKIRHFPVVKGEGNKKSNIVGLISISDLFRYYRSVAHSKSGMEKAGEDHEKPLVGILAPGNEVIHQYIDVFSKFSFKVIPIKNTDEFLREHNDPHVAVIFDMDGFTEATLKDNIIKTKKFAGTLIMVTGHAQMASLFQKYLKPERQFIALKPINLSYVQWLIARNSF